MNITVYRIMTGALVLSVLAGAPFLSDIRAEEGVPPSGLGTESSILPGTPVGLSEAVQNAMSRRPALKTFVHQQVAQHEIVSQARSAYFPQLSASYQNIYGNSFLGYFLFPGYQYFDLQQFTVTLSQNLYDFGRTASQVKTARWNDRKAKDDLKFESLSLVRDVTVAYLKLLMTQHGLITANAGVRDAKNHLAEAEARLDAGVGLRLDVTQAKVNLESALLDRIRADNDFRTAQIELARTIGIRTNPHYVAREISLERFRQRIDLKRDISEAYKHRPDLKSQKDTVRTSESRLSNAKSQNYPALTGLAEYFLTQIPEQALGIPYLPSQAFSTFNVGGTISIPIFEGGLITHQIHAARAQLAADTDQLEEVKLKVAADVQESALSVREARQKLKEAQTAYESAVENDNLVEKAFHVGTAKSVDVVDAETALRQAREALIQARYDWAIQVVQFRYSLGRLSRPRNRNETQ